MSSNKSKKLTNISKILRKNMTKEEKHLWYDFLKDLPQTVNRQKVMGGYVVDFYCAEAKTVIELDGSQHDTQKAQKQDAERDQYFYQQGIAVLRYSNTEIHEHFDDVCEDILRHIAPELFEE